MSTAVIVFVPYLIWSFFGTSGIILIMWYELAFQSFVPFDKIDENKPIVP